jgi:acetyl esterase/lipase
VTVARAVGFATMLGAALAAIALTVLNFAPLTVVNALRERAGYAAQSDLRYRPGERGLLDLYIPLGRAAPAPVVVFFYGGGWQSGAKEDYQFVGAALASAGALVVIPDYRIYPSARFPGFLEDCALAVRWTRDNAQRLGGDPDTIVLMGHSAGAYIAATLALDARWLEAVGLRPGRDLAGWVGLAGPYALAFPDVETRSGQFESSVETTLTQPIAFANATAPPAFLATGMADRTVDPTNTLVLARRIRETGGSATVELFPGLGHRELIGAFSPLLDSLGPVAHDTLAFIFGVSPRPPR